MNAARFALALDFPALDDYSHNDWICQYLCMDSS